MWLVFADLMRHLFAFLMGLLFAFLFSVTDCFHNSPLYTSLQFVSPVWRSEPCGIPSYTQCGIPPRSLFSPHSQRWLCTPPWADTSTWADTGWEQPGYRLQEEELREETCSWFFKDALTVPM